MLYTLVLSTLIALTFGAVRNFHPEKQDILQFNREKIWLWLDNNCFASQTEVLNFKNELLSKYSCLKYNHKKHKQIFKCGENDSMWSLWLDLSDEYDDFSCLDENKDISIASECINKVVYEPYQHHDGMGFKVVDTIMSNHELQATSCVIQTSFAGISATSMYSLDLMDGRIDNEYRYLSFGSPSTSENTKVQAIILDEGVESAHAEFVGLSFNTIYDFDLTTISTFDHGTHVCGTVLGKNVGGAKNTPIWNYPVCQSASGCAWGDIEAGYNGAIQLMQANRNTRYVINYSVGGKKSPLTTPQYDSWGSTIQSLGNIWVTSAGNSAANACNYSPAYSSYAVTVGAFNNQMTPSTWFTNYGTCVDVWAPGENVVSAFPGNAYASASGTSMSSPGIAGLAINLLKQNPSWTPADVRNYFKTSGNYNTLSGTTTTIAPNNYAPFWKTSC